MRRKDHDRLRINMSSDLFADFLELLVGGMFGYVGLANSLSAILKLGYETEQTPPWLRK